MTFIKKNICLKQYSYYQTGGVCSKLYSPRNKKELQLALREISYENLPYFLIGKGSNSLISDDRWSGAVINFSHLNNIIHKEQSLICEAGVENSTIAQKALQQHLSGCSWMYGLPGQIGATVRMNARCYGGEISTITKKISCYTPAGDLVEYEISPSSTVFKGYKDTIFMTNQNIIASCEISLTKGNPKTINAHMHHCKNDRVNKGQFLYPSSGCIFKNDYHPDVSLPAGYMLDAVGAKSLTINNAAVSPYHANFIFNKNNAKSSDILELSFLMQEKVWDEFGVWLNYELEVLGKLPPKLNKRFHEKRSPQYRFEKLEQLRALFKANYVK